MIPVKPSQSFDSWHLCTRFLRIDLHLDKLNVLSLSMEAALFVSARKARLGAVEGVNEERDEIRNLWKLFCLWTEQSERVATDLRD